MPRVLLIDDDPSLLDLVALAFEEAGYEVSTEGDGLRGYEALRVVPPDLVVSDVNMPGLDGFSLCRRLRAEENPVPLLLLTSRSDEIDQALGLELGADDYLSKPFSTRILLARAHALLRRDERRRSQQPERSMRVGDLEVFSERIEVRFKATPIAMTLTEFRLLEALVRRPGIVLSRDRLLEVTRGDDSVVASRIVDTYVRRLRRKLEHVDPSFDRIETIVGAGYRWREGS
ncbi:MAG: response regulator transcription factor [Polyangiaceae bacterium]|nr:response regulator transcription factor [Polyangiaceae bacterium]